MHVIGLVHTALEVYENTLKTHQMLSVYTTPAGRILKCNNGFVSVKENSGKEITLLSGDVIVFEKFRFPKCFQYTLN